MDVELLSYEAVIFRCISGESCGHATRAHCGWDGTTQKRSLLCHHAVSEPHDVCPRTRVEVHNGDLVTVAYSKLVPMESLEMERLWAARN
jgi:hypothetical protein